MVTHTHDGGGSVKKNREQQAEEKKRRLFESLDRKGQAYFGFMEHSGFSMDAVAMLQYLMCKQGSKHHAFPSVREMMQRFRCHNRRIEAAIKELRDGLPEEVFQITEHGGRTRHSYRITPYSHWPISLCEQFWFGVSCVSKVDTHTVSKVDTQTQESVSKVDTLYGNSNGDSLNGNSKETIEHREDQKHTAQKPVDLWAAVAPI